MNPIDGLLSAPAGLGAFGLAAWWLALLLVTALVAGWIARDATSRGVTAPWAFVLAAAFQPLAVMAVYVFAREALAGHEPRPRRLARDP